ncbi:DUF2339 domain-containing protein [Luteolibacter soli]|uniref:DUF2339 domain-containing protein n=1 Tax=Luteolibacter soli TaxID=3135280 RepID=A0ABU9B0J4_9BACT
MTDKETESYRRELQRLNERVDALARGRAAEMIEIRRSIHALEQRLTPQAAPAFVQPEAPEEAPPMLPPTVAEEVPEPPAKWESIAPALAAAKAAAAAVTAKAPASSPPPREWESIAPQAPLPSPLPLPPPAEKGSFELRFGRIWLVRLGIALLVTGLVLLGNFAYKNWIRDLPAGVRLAALYLGSFLISGSGVYLGAKETMRRFGDVLLAGGLAFFYWCTFAAHHVPRLQVIESPVTAGVLLLGAAGAIVGVSLRRDSRVTATMGLLLASYSTILQPLGWLSATSNVVLAVAGTSFLLRPGWALPGMASMAGTYIAFFWWQIAGGSGGRPDDPSALWFLPPVWAVFALPSVIGVSRHFGGLSERARSIFASVNNIAFFLLFSALWMEQHRTWEGYWVVPGVFGAVLLAMGVAGRSRDDVAGGVHVAQGLAALTLAMAIKLDGFQLALGFAMQTLALSFAFRRFAGKSELAFALVAGLSTLFVSLGQAGPSSDIPLWSHALVAALLVAAAFPLRDGCDRWVAKRDLAQAARAITSIVFIAGGLLTMLFCMHHLAAPWRAPACGVVALGWSAFTLLRDPQRRLLEAGWAALVFGIASLPMLYPGDIDLPWWPPVMVALLGLAGHRLWLDRDRAPLQADIAKVPEVFLWLTALTVTVAISKEVKTLPFTETYELVALASAAVGMVAVGRFLIISPVLQIAAVLLLPLALQIQTRLTGDSGVLLFIPVIAALGVIPLARPTAVAVILARFAAGFSWLIAWNKLAPDAWGEVMAASAVALAIVSMRRGKITLPESWAFLATATAELLAHTCVLYRWVPMNPAPFPYGAITVASCFALPLLALAGDAFHRSIRHGLLLAASALLALWSSQAVIWHFDWKPVAILWTVLGFGLVSVGLWQKLSALRHAGFALLAVALVKLFAVDVWDFGTFIRIAAFLALGVALVVLGFFYNRFADALKKLFEADEA